MDEFLVWFNTGFEHILDWNGYDHILYVLVLCAGYLIADWKKLVVLITAFTIGHSITLAVSVLNIIQIKQSYIEVLIPLTILLTALNNIFLKKHYMRANYTPNYKVGYGLALFFGFIHGMGFSYLLKAMLGKEQNIVMPLLSFNLGLEMGQLIIVCCLLLFSALLFKFTRIKKHDWIFFISSAVFGNAFLLFIQRLSSL